MHCHFEAKKKKRKKFRKLYPRIYKQQTCNSRFLGCCTLVVFVVELKPCKMEMVALLCVGSNDRNLLQGLSVHISVSMGKHEWY